MFKHKNVSADGSSHLKNDILKPNKSVSELSLAAGLPNITHIPLHLDLDWSSDTTTNLSSSTPQSKSSSSSSSLPAMIVDGSLDASKSGQRRLDFNATRSSPNPRGALEGDYNLHDESPFEAARRAQQRIEIPEDRPPSDNQYIPGHSRFPSIKPGDIVPHYLIWTVFEPPAFLPPLEAPPFPPDVQPIHHPIRPAHFPGSAYLPPNLHLATSQIQSPYPFPSSSPVQSSPNPHQGPRHPNGTNSFHSESLPPPGSLSQLQSPRVPSPVHSSRSVPVSAQVHPSPPLVRSNTDSIREAPVAFRPNDSQFSRDALMPLSIPRGPPPPQPRSAPPTRAPSQRPLERHYLQPSREAQFTQSLPPPRPTGHQPHTPSPLHSDFVPASSPVRLPSEHFRMTQSEHGHGGSESRPTPKPVMPRPLARENYLSVDEKNAANLKRSISNVPPKGGFFSRTKSLLRKRTSTSTIRLNTDGSIGLSHETLSALSEEEKRPPSNKLSKRK